MQLLLKFLVNRVGDFGFALGIFGTYLLFDTIVLDEIFILAPKYVETELTFLWFSADAITVLTMLLSSVRWVSQRN